MIPHPERKAAKVDSLATRAAKLQQVCGQAGEELLRAVDALPVPLAIWQVADGEILYTNACLEETLGVRPGSLWGRDLSAFIPKLADRRKVARRADQNGCAHGVEVESRREDGRPLWLAVWQQRMICAGRECLLTFLVNITDRKQEEVEWQAGRQALQLLLHKSDRDQEVLACEIHDGLIQEITGALMFLEAAQQAIEQGQPDSVKQLQTVADLLRDGIKEARRLMDGARGPDLDQEGLVGAVEVLIDKFSATSGIAIEFVHDRILTRLAPSGEQAVYRMIQESLNNVRRHSQSVRARVELTQQEDHLEIVVRDWGIGFDPRRSGAKTFGLRSLRQRAQLLGGSLCVESSRGAGTVVRIRLPLSREAGVS